MQIASSLEPAELAEVIDLADHLRARHAEGEQSSSLYRRMEADPALLTRVEAMIQVGRDAVARGEVIDGETAISSLRAKYRLDDSRA